MHTIQQRILKLAKKQDISQLGYRKLGEKVNVEHPQQVKYHLQKLIDTGRLIRTPFGVLKVGQPNETVARLFHIPILGQANCGEPLSFAEDSDWGNLTVSPSMVATKQPKKLFAVRAVGDSMNRCSINGQSIESGDYVIVDGSQEVPDNGSYVVSSLEGLANIKKYVRDETNHLIKLVSESTRIIPPITLNPADVESYRIHGRVVQVIKP